MVSRRVRYDGETMTAQAQGRTIATAVYNFTTNPKTGKAVIDADRSVLTSFNRAAWDMFSRKQKDKMLAFFDVDECGKPVKRSFWRHVVMGEKIYNPLLDKLKEDRGLLPSRPRSSGGYANESDLRRRGWLSPAPAFSLA